MRSRGRYKGYRAVITKSSSDWMWPSWLIRIHNEYGQRVYLEVAWTRAGAERKARRALKNLNREPIVIGEQHDEH